MASDSNKDAIIAALRDKISKVSDENVKLIEENAVLRYKVSELESARSSDVPRPSTSTGRGDVAQAKAKPKAPESPLASSASTVQEVVQTTVASRDKPTKAAAAKTDTPKTRRTPKKAEQQPKPAVAVKPKMAAAAKEVTIPLIEVETQKQKTPARKTNNSVSNADDAHTLLVFSPGLEEDSLMAVSEDDSNEENRAPSATPCVDIGVLPKATNTECINCKASFTRGSDLYQVVCAKCLPWVHQNCVDESVADKNLPKSCFYCMLLKETSDREDNFDYPMPARTEQKEPANKKDEESDVGFEDLPDQDSSKWTFYWNMHYKGENLKIGDYVYITRKELSGSAKNLHGKQGVDVFLVEELFKDGNGRKWISAAANYSPAAIKRFASKQYYKAELFPLTDRAGSTALETFAGKCAVLPQGDYVKGRHRGISDEDTFFKRRRYNKKVADELPLSGKLKPWYRPCRIDESYVKFEQPISMASVAKATFEEDQRVMEEYRSDKVSKRKKEPEPAAPTGNSLKKVKLTRESQPTPVKSTPKATPVKIASKPAKPATVPPLKIKMSSPKKKPSTPASSSALNSKKKSPFLNGGHSPSLERTPVEVGSNSPASSLYNSMHRIPPSYSYIPQKQTARKSCASSPIANAQMKIISENKGRGADILIRALDPLRQTLAANAASPSATRSSPRKDAEDKSQHSNSQNDKLRSPRKSQ